MGALEEPVIEVAATIFVVLFGIGLLAVIGVFVIEVAKKVLN